jgi:hypothetical protein
MCKYQGLAIVWQFCSTVCHVQGLRFISVCHSTLLPHFRHLSPTTTIVIVRLLSIVAQQLLLGHAHPRLSSTHSL